MPRAGVRPRWIVTPSTGSRRGRIVDWLLNADSLVALLTLTALEIVLGIDNIVFISIIAAKLPGAAATSAPAGPRAGDGHAYLAPAVHLVDRRLTEPLFTVLGQEISGRDLILIAGGLFLLAKSTFEIHDKLEGESVTPPAGCRPPSPA